MRRRHGVATAGLILVLAGCGTGAGSAPSPTSTVTTVTTVTAVTTASLTPASPTPAGGPTSAPGSVGANTVDAIGDSVQVPVTTMPAADGALKVVVEISVGGGAPVPVILDAGSSGLLIDAAAVGPDVDSTGAVPFTKNYLGASLSGDVVQAPVTLGSLSTSAIGVATYTADAASAGLTDSLARGILGIAAEATAGPDPVLWSPAMQLPAPYGTGWSLDVAATGAGVWTLGPTPAATDAITVPLVAVPGAPTAGGPWTKDVSLCWTFPGVDQACGPTDLDSGASSVLVDSAVVPGTVPSGSAVTLATPDGATLWSFTSDDSVKLSTVQTADLGEPTHYNTGIGFYLDHLVAFDYAAGTLTLTPK